MLHSGGMQVERAEALVSEESAETATRTAEEIYAQVFHQMRPRTPIPLIRVKFCRYASASAKLRLEDGVLEVRIADTLTEAPDSVMEALAEILLSKLFRRPVPAHCNERYRRYLNRRDVRRKLDIVRQTRGRKQVEGAQGKVYNLDQIFDEINFQYFHGLMAKPILGWSPNASRTLLGHYDPSHNTIVMSRILDRPQTPRVAVEYVLFHEMLHVRYPAEHRGARRCVHTKEFKQAEKQFKLLNEAEEALRRL